VLPAISSLAATYLLVASPYLTSVVKFIVCSIRRLASAWGTLMFYRRTLESILTWNSTSDMTRNFSIHTHNISCSLTTGGEAHGGQSLKCPVLLTAALQWEGTSLVPFGLTSKRCSSQHCCHINTLLYLKIHSRRDT
jgi:hypothetical protein